MAIVIGRVSIKPVALASLAIYEWILSVLGWDFIYQRLLQGASLHLETILLRKRLSLQGPVALGTLHNTVKGFLSGFQTPPLPAIQEARIILLPFYPVNHVLTQVRQEFEPMSASPCRNHHAIHTRHKVDNKMIVERVCVPAQSCHDWT